MAVPKSDIVFAFPPANQIAGSFKNHLGVSYLRASLAAAGIKCEQYLRPKPGSIREVAGDLLAFHPRMIGFTAYDANFPLCLAIARSIKALNSDTKIVLGGPCATFSATQLLARHEAIDLCILGEAAEATPTIMQTLMEQDFLDNDQKGIAFRRDDKIVCNGAAPLLGGTASALQCGLDMTPSPYLNGLLQDGRTGVLTGRGCTHNCQFCCFAALARRKLRLHSVERILAELEVIAAHQNRTGDHYVVPIHDDAFTLLPERAKNLCEAIIARKFRLRFSSITRADRVDDELLKVMRASGFVSLAFGLESAVPSVLRAIGKVRPPNYPSTDLEPERRFVEQVRQSVISAHKLGLSVGVSIILGLPSETAADGETTLDFVRMLPIDYYMHNYLWVFPGTPLWENHKDYGIECTINEIGLAETSEYAYQVEELRPAAKCDLEADAKLIQELTADALVDCESSSGTSNSVGTVVIEADRLMNSTAAWLHDILAVGGTVVQVYHASSREQLDAQLDHDRCVIAEHLVPVRYYIQLSSNGWRNGSLSYRISCPGLDSYVAHRPKLGVLSVTADSCPLLNWLRSESPLTDICDLSTTFLRSPELVGLARRIDAQPQPSPLQEMPIPPRFRYPGRWLKECISCRSLNRLEVDDHGDVRPCRAAAVLGKVGDSKQVLKRRFSRMALAAQERRGCDHCNTADCPKCTFPGMDDRFYCDAMTHCTEGRTLNWIRLYSRLRSVLARQKDQIGSE